MSLIWMLIGFAHALPIASADLMRDHFKNGQEVVVAGKLDGSSYPARFNIRPGKMNEETVLLRKVSPEQILRYDGLPIVVTGTLIQSKPQWTIEVSAITSAKSADLKKTLLSK